MWCDQVCDQRLPGIAVLDVEPGADQVRDRLCGLPVVGPSSGAR